MVLMMAVGAVFTVIVLMQEGNESGLGSIAGTSGTFWDKNKARSASGVLKKLTVLFGILLLVLAVLLNTKLFA